MNRYRIPTFNFFTSLNLNRNAGKRTDSAWLKKMIGSGDAKIILSSDMKFLFNADHGLDAVFSGIDNLKDFDLNYEDFIYLGEKDHSSYFSLDITGYPEILHSVSSSGQFKELRALASYLNEEDAAVLAYARALIYWRNNHKYCGKCGSPFLIKDAGHKLVCSNQNCSSENFPRTDPAVIMLVEKDGRCLLARQAKWPNARYSTIAGFVEPGESLEQAVQREVLEETGVKVDHIEYHSSQPWPFPASIMLGFRAAAYTEKIILGDNELEDAKWFSRKDIIENVKNNILGFPPFISVSFKLIQDWFDEDSPVKLKDLIDSAG